jgi:hypothetical protein
MSLNRLIVVLAVLITGIFFVATESFAGKPGKCSPWPECKDDGGEPPPPPPTGCTDAFPGFLYEVEATRKLPAELHLASTEGCRTEQIAILPDLRHGIAFHMTSDRSKGVVVWREDIGNNNQIIVRRLDFTVDGLGDLILGDPVTILPLVDEEAPQGDWLGYSSLDISGDATHDSLYLATKRNRTFGPDINSGAGSLEALVYDLNALTGVNPSPLPDVREIYYEDTVSWGGVPDWQDVEEPECNDFTLVPFPRFVPSCYRPEEFRFNPSGTRIYIEGKLFLADGRREYAVMRINIDSSEGPDLADWTITGPEMVYVDGPRNARPRPDIDPLQLPSPEIVTAGGQFLNADDCAEDYDFYAKGDDEPELIIWPDCTAPDLLAHGDARSWESPDSYLFDRLSQQGRGKYNIYRVYVSGGVADTEALLIETARHADTGQ